MKGLKSGIKLYEHQKTGRDFIKSSKYVLIGDEPGLGKSLQALAVMSEIPGLKIIICPSFLRFNWRTEINKFTNMTCEVVDSKTEYIKVPEVLISSYENVKNIPSELLPSFIVLDESHYIKNLKASRTKAVLNLMSYSQPEYFVALSGTPILNNVTEFFTILKLLSCCPSKTNGIPIAQKSQYGFSIKFSNSSTRNITVPSKGGTRSVSLTEFKGVRNIELLKRYLKGKFLRRLAKNVIDLPKVTYVPFVVDTKKSKATDSLYKAYSQWVEGNIQSDHITHLKISSAMSKVPYTAKLAIELLSQREKVVIFSDHKDPVELLKKTIEAAGFTVRLLTGDIDSTTRDQSVNAFQNGNLDCIIGTIKAASIGITLTASRNLIYNDFSWIPADMEQADRRVNRISQERPVTITYVLNGEFDIKLQDKISTKRKEIKQVYE